jgi:hypothetical protein
MIGETWKSPSALPSEFECNRSHPLSELIYRDGS